MAAATALLALFSASCPSSAADLLAPSDQAPPWQEQARRLNPEHPNQQRQWYAEHQRLLGEVRQSQSKILFIGDSNTAHWSDRGLATWDRLFAPYGALNLGVDGDTTQNVLWRLDHGELSGLSPKVVILLIGAGDLIVPTERGRWSTNEIVKGILMVAATVRRDLPHPEIILLGVLPARSSPRLPIRHDIAQINDELAHAKLPGDTIFLDVGTQLLDGEGFERSADYQPDGLHLSPAGYAVEGALLDPLVKRFIE